MIKLLYKKQGLSSFQAIKEFAKLNNIKKIGHTGTLDPLAEGLLLVATDEDTKLIPYLDKENKTYIAKMQFGYSSDTYDIEGEVKKINDLNKVDLISIQKVLPNFIGEILQIPPIFSAKKIGGKRAYELARNNQNIELKPQKVFIENIKIISFDYDKQELTFETTVSRGTYIRSLIHDLGKSLNNSAIMTYLLRNKLNNLILEDLKKEEIDPISILNLPFLEIEKKELEILLKGQKIKYNYIPAKNEYALLFCQKIIGFGIFEENILISKKLFGKKIEKILGDLYGKI